jgi:hypothetical protein
VVQLYAEHWFRLYLHPTREPPPAPDQPKALDESARRTEINASKHKEVINAK